ncbi:PfkB family carbohydrate kinase [Actinopolymorpha sp. NPDC004070]|uniref:carbohydrate kinase family protein n=1 Tax=Actinopolymorpha sp. NPDC004070 TaxID=3154548 RepID=UPI0033BF016E
MSRLVFVGSVNDDAIAVVPHIPGPDQRLLAEALVHAGGGNSATAAVAAARLGGDVAFVGPIAEDPTGERIVADLTREGVDVSGVVPVPAGAGGASVVLVDRSSGTRAICTRALPAFELGPRARDLVAAAAWVHLDHLGWPAARDVLADISERPAQPRISVDEGNPIPGFHPRGVDLYGPTVDRLRLTYGDHPVGVLLERARAGGAGLVVATAGGDGAHLLPASGEPVHVPGFAVEVVSTLGAGDVFHGALLLAVDRGLDLPDAVRYANGAAALACRAIDGRSGIPTHDELTTFLTSRP